MVTNNSVKLETYRVLCLKKDLVELNYWMEMVEAINAEISEMIYIEQHLIKNSNMQNSLSSIRRKNTLVMGKFCQYEVNLKKEINYSQQAYDLTRAKEHEKKRDLFYDLIAGFRKNKHLFYQQLKRMRRVHP